MFPQQSPPQFGQQSDGSVYNGGGSMNVNVPGGLNSMGQMPGQVGMGPMGSVPTPGLPSMGPEQVGLTHPWAVTSLTFYVGNVLSSVIERVPSLGCEPTTPSRT